MRYHEYTNDTNLALACSRKADEFDTDIKQERMVWVALKACAKELYKKPLK